MNKSGNTDKNFFLNKNKSGYTEDTEKLRGTQRRTFLRIRARAGTQIRTFLRIRARAGTQIRAFLE